MRFRKSGKKFVGASLSVCVAAVALMALPGLAQGKETMLYHGNGFAIRPATVSNWEYNGFASGMSGGQTVAGLKGQSTNRLPDGAMKWKSWGRKNAVGYGGLHTYCGTMPKRTCKTSAWYGTPRVKVHAYGLERGHFSKMKISETGRGGDHFMILHFIGKQMTPAWKVVRDTGAALEGVQLRSKPSTLLYHGNGFAYRPKTISGWTKDEARTTYQIFGGEQGKNTGNWGRIAWGKWNHVRAVGFGRMFSPDCESGTCASLYPWNGTRGKVVADRTRNGHFTRMTFITRDGPDRPYELTVKFVGLRKSGVSWKVLREVGG